MHRVQKLLSNYGYCSRRAAEELISEGRVRVNDKIISLGDKASEEDEIFVDSKKVSKEKKRYLLFNKPEGCVCALTDQHERTIFSYIKIEERVFPIGRLDKNTSGVLLLTNDGDFANQVMHPRYELKKTYEADVDRAVLPKDVEMLKNGVLLEDGKTLPAKVVAKGKRVTITIHEGKNRIVRRMLEALGYKVTQLHRSKVGSIALGSLKEGAYRELGEKERLGLVKE